MNRLFFRFFLLVMLAITLATFAIYFTLSRLFGDPIEDIAMRQAAAQIQMLEQYVDKAPSDEWLARLNKTREVLNIDFELIPLQVALDALPASKRAALQRGDITVDIGRKSLSRRVDLTGERYIGSNEEVIRLIGLPIEIGNAFKIEAVRFIIVALCLLIPASLWSRAHWRSLQALSDAAAAIGAGRLSTRTALPLSDSIYPLAARMNQMAERIESLIESHKALLHSVSHELRTPIARMRFSLELLREAREDTAREKRFDSIESDLAELETLVIELLQVSRPELPLAQRSKFDLAVMLRQVIGSTEHGLGDKQLLTDFDSAEVAIHGDARLLGRAVGNLLRNAQKYAKHTIGVGARLSIDGVHITVEDDGPGIPQAERTRVFEAFYRLDRSRDRTTGGFGLGLSIAQRAVAAHGGSIIVDDSPLGGARFTITLPEQQGIRAEIPPSRQEQVR
ncbi:MAG: HAMP domain-containing protein [Betaproteobacteria bacterium]|nr:HAMP domain-containing protein [Betaproteobacteria bacterium]